VSEEDKGTFAILAVIFGAIVLCVLFTSAASVGRTRACYEALAAGADVVCEVKE
jgi:hypothetical protein